MTALHHSHSVRYSPLPRTDEARPLYSPQSRRASTPCNRASKADRRASGSRFTAAHGLCAVLAGLVLFAVVSSLVRIGGVNAFTGFAVCVVLVVLASAGACLVGRAR